MAMQARLEGRGSASDALVVQHPGVAGAVQSPCGRGAWVGNVKAGGGGGFVYVSVQRRGMNKSDREADRGTGRCCC